MDKRPIGVFDSGLGGLSVIKELNRVLPNENIVYFGDTGRVPYGTKSPETIVKYARQDEKFLLSHDVKLIIAACGTVSSVAGFTANELPVPFIEVVTPAAKAAVKATKTNKIGVLGTAATVNSSSYKQAMLKINPVIEVWQVACPLFVQLVESGWIDRDDEVTIATAKRYLQPLIDAKVDTVILGCTHFPAIKDIIGDIMGDEVTLINSGEQAALAAAEYLKECDLLGDGGRRQYFVSDRAESFASIAGILLGSDIPLDVETVNLDRTGG
ncbi:MAG: glutamate racemase [Clostridia bacterium]|nr:glutamate racemase [Clostridia bacterium]